MSSVNRIGIFVLAVVCQNMVLGNPMAEAGDLSSFEIPSANEVSQVRFLLWTSSNSGNNAFYELKNGDNTNLNNSPFTPSLKTYFIIHGYQNSGTEPWILEAKSNILALGPSNVIAVDWGVYANVANYLSAVNSMYEVGALTGQFIDFLVSASGTRTSEIEMTGHSLGAHCCGMAGKAVTTGTISRITGMDPAGPNFYTVDADQRLDKSQADFVDVIHSNGCVDTGCYGLFKAIGDADFYPNGGQNQPGCGIDLVGCSHGRSHEFWSESIRAGYGGTDLTFVSWPCDSWETFSAGGCPSCGNGCLDMGFHSSRRLSGSYFLKTDKSSPYALGNGGN